MSSEPLATDSSALARQVCAEIIADYKEHYSFPNEPQGESHMHDCIMDALEALLSVRSETRLAMPRYIAIGFDRELCRFDTGEWSLRQIQPDNDRAHIRYLDASEKELVEAALDPKRHTHER